MALSRIYEEHEVSAETQRLYSDIRSSFDLPFVPSIFKLVAAHPEYLKLIWNDLSPVVRSREFQTAATALEEYCRSIAVGGGWKFSDQERVLATQKFSYNDIEQLGAIVATFTRSLAKMTLFTRLMQRGYAGGQRGRVWPGKQASALSRMVTLHVPPEGDGGLRVWLLYSDIRRTLGVRNPPSVFRVLSPFPAYLASVWLDSKKLLNDATFSRAREDVSKRALGLVLGLPVRDHRQEAKTLVSSQWREIEETVDGLARLTPQLALLAAIWYRSFGTSAGRSAVA